MLCSRCGTQNVGATGFCNQCGADLERMATSQRIDLLDILRVAEHELLPGTNLMKRYSLVKPLGAGRFGIVYLAYDAELKLEVAIKVLNSLVAQDSAMIREFWRQNDTITRLQHKHIVSLRAMHDDGERKFLVMEYADGLPLENLLSCYPSRKLPEEMVLEWARPIGEALDYAHGRKILHLDLKPKNILRSRNGAVKVSGFGLAKIARALTTRLSSTDAPAFLAYLAPEQILEQPTDARTDVYAFGAILYEMLSGRPPFYSDNVRQAILQNPPAFLAQVSESTNQVLQKALAKDRNQRWKSAAEMIEALNGPAPLMPELGREAGAPTSESSDRATTAKPGAEADTDGPSLLDEYRLWMETNRESEKPADPVYDELRRVELDRSRMKILDENYSTEKERREREAILRIEAEHFAQKLKKREEQLRPERNAIVRVWSAGITVLMGILLSLFVYKLYWEQGGVTGESVGPEAAATQRTEPAGSSSLASAFNVRESVLTTIEHNAADTVRDIRISPDTSKVAYKVRQGRQWSVMLGGMSGPGFDAIDQIIFSPNKGKLAYRATQDGLSAAVLNQKSGSRYEAVDNLSFSPNGEILAYIAGMANKFFVVRNNKKEPEYEWVGQLVFSPDSRRMAYAAKKGEHTFVVSGRERGQQFSGIGDLVFSPDSRRLAYVAREGDQEAVIVGNERGPSFSRIIKPVFSPDSRSLAYIARQNDREFVLVNDKKGPEYERITALNYGPDGRTVIYVAQQEGKSFVVNGDQPGPGFDAISNLVVSPNSEITAYVAKENGKQFLVLQGEKGPAFDQITGLVFSSDSNQLAYIAKEAGKEFIVVGNKRGPALDEVWQPVFSPDARKIVYGARVGNSVLRVEMSTI